MSKRVGPTNWYTDQIFKNTEPLDILFVGSSRMMSAIDHTTLRQEIGTSRAHFTSATLAALFNADDLSYTFLKDFFARRKARLVVLNYPDPRFPQTDSNPSEKYIRSLDSGDPGLDLARPTLFATSYSEMALIAPRLWVASIVPPGPIVKGVYNFMSDTADPERTHGTLALDWGYSKREIGGPYAPFVRSDLPTRPLPAIVIRPGAPLPPEVALIDAPLTPIEAAYLPAIKALCEKNGAVLVLMKQPFAERQDPKIIELSRQIIALGIPIVATSRERLFGDTPKAEVVKFYHNYFHLNSNGARRDAQAFAPALSEFLRQ